MQPKITVRNVVASFAFESNLNLRKVLEIFREECFFETLNDERYTFRVISIRMKKPHCTFLVYKTGKVVCVGARSIEIAKQSHKYIAERFHQGGLNIQLKEKATIHNIVATTTLREPITLEQFLLRLTERKQFQAIYEPEQFPAAILKIPIEQNTKATILLFSSGKMVIAGLTTLE